MQPLIAQSVVVCQAQEEESKARIMLASLDVCVSCARLGVVFECGNYAFTALYGEGVKHRKKN